MKLEGDCLDPVIPHAAAVMMQKSEPWGAGDFVTIWFRPELLKPGMCQSWIKKVTLNMPPWVKGFPYNDHPQSEVKAILIVEQLNPRQCYRISCDAIQAIHKVIKFAPGVGKVGGSVNSNDFRPIGGVSA